MALLPRSIKLAYVMAISFSAVMAFSLVHRVDGDIIIGANAVIRVDDAKQVSAKQSLSYRLEKFAEQKTINIGRLGVDLSDFRKRVLYLSVGDQNDDSAGWLRLGYPAFNTDADISVLPMAAAAEIDPRAYYFLFGDHVDASVIRSFQDEIHSSGLAATLGPPLTVMTVYAFFYGAPLQCFLAVGGAIICLVLLAVVFSCKSYGIQRLQGRSFARIAGRDLKMVATFATGSLGVCMLAVGVSLFAYNRLHRFDFYLWIWFGILGVLIALALMTHVLALLLASRVPIPTAIKGEVPAKQAIIGMFGIRIFSAGVALTVASALLVTWQTLDGKQESQEWFSAAGSAVRISMNGALDKESDRQFREVGAWIREADRNGRAVLSHRGMLNEFIPEYAPYGEVLTVNGTYLVQQKVQKLSGERVLRDSKINLARVLIPPNLAPDKERITRAMTRWIDFLSRKHGVTAPPIEVSMALAGQRLFTYGSGAAEAGNPILVDPVVVIIPASNILTDIDYAAYASQSSVIFPDPGFVKNAMRGSALETYINGVEPIALRAAYENRDVSVRFWFMMINLMIAVAIVMLSAIGMSHLYVQKNAQRIFAQSLFGWPAVRVHVRLIAVEVGLIISFVAYVAYDTLERLRFRQHGAPRTMPPSVAEEIMSVNGWEPVLAAIVVFVGLCGSLGVLGILGKRVGRNAAAGS
ncbi:hypothetical protein [Streptosporangium sp. NPDC006007]|uniref:hypothetical protein n=1 Tax=Streptosporangium sp. NPDC006007 TaxID=3154575 RepID=UPI0033A43FE1